MGEFVVNILLPTFAILLPVVVTLYTVDNRIKARNKENHQPYLILEKVENVKKFDELSYFLTPVGRNYLEKHGTIDYDKLTEEDYILVKLALHNIGYGVATNIKFYNLLNGEQVHGDQKSDPSKDQKLFTTLDMEATEIKHIQTRLIKSVSERKHTEDQIRLLCVYTDLNDNVYDLIISINAKNNKHYDFYAYEPSSKSYKSYKKIYLTNYKKIVKDYSE